MNQLSWLIYLADVCGSAGGWLGWIGGICGLITGATVILSLIITGGLADTKDVDGIPEVWKVAYKILCWTLPLFLICLVLNIITPSRETIYAIAASEVGEELISSPTAAKATRALEAWIDAQIPNPARDTESNSENN
jgi:hypothetical protein